MDNYPIEQKSFRKSISRSISRAGSRPGSGVVSDDPLSLDALDRRLDAAKREQQRHPKWPRGIRPWISLTGCFFLMFNSWGLVNAYGTFSSYYRQHLMPSKDLLDTATIGGTECFIVLLLSLFVGKLLDVGYYRYFTIAGSVLVTAGMFSLAWTSGPGQRGDGKYPLIWLTQGFVLGLGMACFFVTSSQIAATWFVRRKATAIGIVASGASIAGLVYPVATKYLIESIGWRNGVLAVTGIVLFTSLIAVFCATPNPDFLDKAYSKRADLNKQPGGFGWLKIGTWIDLHAFRHRSFCWFVAAIAFLFFGFYPVFFNLEAWGASTGVGFSDKLDNDGAVIFQQQSKGTIKTFFLLGIMNGSSTVGRIVAAILSDKIATPIVHMVATGVCGVLCLALWTTAKNLASTIAFAVIFGIFSGAVIGLPPASMAWILGHTDAGRSKLGQWTGTMYFCAAIPAMVGPVVVGHLVSKTGVLLPAQLWAGVSLVLSAACMGIATWYGTVNHPADFVPFDPFAPSMAPSIAPSNFTSKAPTICITVADGEDDEEGDGESGSPTMREGRSRPRTANGTAVTTPAAAALTPSGAGDVSGLSKTNSSSSTSVSGLDGAVANSGPRQTTLSFATGPLPSQLRLAAAAAAAANGEGARGPDAV